MNRTKDPHRGGVPKGFSYRANAALYAKMASDYGRGHRYFTNLIFLALKTVRDGSRSPTTRAEARRLLSLLEARS